VQFLGCHVRITRAMRYDGRPSNDGFLCKITSTLLGQQLGRTANVSSFEQRGSDTPEVSSQLQGAAARSETIRVPSAPLAKRRIMAAVSSTGKPRATLDLRRLDADDIAGELEVKPDCLVKRYPRS